MLAQPLYNLCCNLAVFLALTYAEVLPLTEMWFHLFAYSKSSEFELGPKFATIHG